MKPVNNLRDILLLFVIIITCLSFGQKEDKTMIMPATSEINRYEWILRLKILQQSPGEWVPDPDNTINLMRNVTIKVEILEVLKGDDFPEIKEMEAVVVQRKPASGRFADYYGPWSDIDLESKPELLLFCAKTKFEDMIAEEIARDSVTIIPLPHDRYPSAVEDVRMAVKINKEFLKAGEPETFDWLSLIKKSIDSREHTPGPLFARYITDISIQIHAATDDLLFLLLQNNEMIHSFRSILLTHIYEQLSLNDDPDMEEKTYRFIRIMAGILQEPDAREMHENIIQTYFFNTIFDVNNRALYSIKKVYTDKEQMKKIFSLIESLPFEEGKKQYLLNWASGMGSMMMPREK
jgi:hypothetical protein